VLSREALLLRHYELFYFSRIPRPSIRSKKPSLILSKPVAPEANIKVRALMTPVHRLHSTLLSASSTTAPTPITTTTTSSHYNTTPSHPYQGRPHAPCTHTPPPAKPSAALLIYLTPPANPYNTYHIPPIMSAEPDHSQSKKKVNLSQ
jgi:hypothetical protein